MPSTRGKGGLWLHACVSLQSRVGRGVVYRKAAVPAIAAEKGFVPPPPRTGLSLPRTAKTLRTCNSRACGSANRPLVV